jgi:hypothetical protein
MLVGFLVQQAEAEKMKRKTSEARATSLPRYRSKTSVKAKRIPGERENDSGVKTNRIPGWRRTAIPAGRRTVLADPGMAFTMPGMFLTGTAARDITMASKPPLKRRKLAGQETGLLGIHGKSTGPNTRCSTGGVQAELRINWITCCTSRWSAADAVDDFVLVEPTGFNKVALKDGESKGLP